MTKKTQKYIRRSKERDDKFFAAYERCPNKTKAAKVAGYSRSAVRKYEKDDTFKTRLLEAQLSYDDRVYEKHMTRILKGDKRPLFYKDAKIGEVITYPDSLVSKYLKNSHPERFGDNEKETDIKVPNLNITLSTDDNAGS